MSREDELEDFIDDSEAEWVDTRPDDDWDTDEDENGSMDDGDDCTFYSDASAVDRARAVSEHNIQGVLHTYDRTSKWAHERWVANRRAAISSARGTGSVTDPVVIEEETPTSP